MPVGSALAKDIEERLGFYFDSDRLQQGDSQLADLFQATGNQRQVLFEAARHLCGVLRGFNSIDDCLYTHGEDPAVRGVGKLAIARSISAFENRSWLRGAWSIGDDRDNAISRLWGGWASGVIKAQATGLRASERLRLFENLTVITFNYDRCAETAFFHLVRETLSIGDEETAAVMKGLKVFRPYGGLGELHWPGRRGVAFGPSRPDLHAMADRIFVYTEDLGDRPDLDGMTASLEAADNIIFLGFGFHSQNMKLLDVDAKDKARQVFATTFGEPPPRRDAFAMRINGSFGRLARAQLAPAAYGTDQFMKDYAVLFTA
jgi:hypothetical protein